MQVKEGSSSGGRGQRHSSALRLDRAFRFPAGSRYSHCCWACFLESRNRTLPPFPCNTVEFPRQTFSGPGRCGCLLRGGTGCAGKLPAGKELTASASRGSPPPPPSFLRSPPPPLLSLDHRGREAGAGRGVCLPPPQNFLPGAPSPGRGTGPGPAAAAAAPPALSASQPPGSPGH